MMSGVPPEAKSNNMIASFIFDRGCAASIASPRLSECQVSMMFSYWVIRLFSLKYCSPLGSMLQDCCPCNPETGGFKGLTYLLFRSSSRLYFTLSSGMSSACAM